MPTLPTDIFRIVLGHLNLKDLLNMRLVAKELYDLSKLRSVWITLIYRELIFCDIPVPGLRGRAIEDLSGPDLEQSFHHALRLRKNWLSPSPTIAQTLHLPAIPGTQIAALHILSVYNRNWLVSLSVTTAPHLYTVRCWNLELPTPVCVAHRRYSIFRRMVVNKEATDAGHLAVVTAGGIEILQLDPSSTSPETGFNVVDTVQAVVANLHHFYKNFMIVRDVHQRLLFFDITKPQLRIELEPLIKEPSPIKDCVVTDTLVVVVKAQTLEIYALPDELPENDPPVNHYPIASHDWRREMRWPVDTASVTLRHRSPGDITNPNNPITIFIRFQDAHGGPDRMLYCYRLLPSQDFRLNESPDEMNVPYRFPPDLCQTVLGPVHLQPPYYDLVVGPYGTAIWTDTHTEEGHFDHPNHRQRIGGFYASLGWVGREGPVLDVGSSPVQTSVYAYNDEDSWSRLALNETDGMIEITSRPCLTAKSF